MNKNSIQFNSFILQLTKKYNINTLKMIHNIPTNKIKAHFHNEIKSNSEMAYFGAMRVGAYYFTNIFSKQGQF